MVLDDTEGDADLDHSSNMDDDMNYDNYPYEGSILPPMHETSSNHQGNSHQSRAYPTDEWGVSYQRAREQIEAYVAEAVEVHRRYCECHASRYHIHQLVEKER